MDLILGLQFDPINFRISLVINSRLAKISLPEEECASIMRRWANYLIDTKELKQAIHVLLTLGDFFEVLVLLYKNSSFETAALFNCALPDILKEQVQKVISVGPHSEKYEELLSEIYMGYAEQLAWLGCEKLSNHYKNMCINI
eukprot:TRINITY_DN1815_c0_g1_i1.p1 TRINITY_DN1815_c0_g1~~TRINITY_DN1815_c0_g1_i1.p1  ORF type:complete len:143 (+),score=22.63 TRINITY_DN1815_c0_g1_i1:137-565(+)